MLNRREFTKIMGAAGLIGLPAFSTGQFNSSAPSYLKGFAQDYSAKPHSSSMDWFRAAKFGLFLHYGLYSLLGRGEWVQIKEKIHVKEYEKLIELFTAENFDADEITDLALRAEMKYVNITTRHHDSFCLFDTKSTDFNSVKSPAKRDLVAELAEACEKKGLGLCLYFSHGRDWRHPHAPNNDKWGSFARPKYYEPELYYKYGKEHDLDIYIEYMHQQINELLTQYGPIASIWLDGHGVPMSGPIEKFRVDDTYKLIRKLQPQCLITSKWGYNGQEDYYSPEIHWLKDKEKVKKKQAAGKPFEICTAIAGWGYTKKHDGNHRGFDSVLDNLKYAADYDANLLLNTGPLPDGSLDKQDVNTLHKVGEYIRKNGFPK
ncbi:Alpha-L-fucosidase [Sedimentisphaera cyanobacteriorum]|uniref:alpha-L-fucosidase n=1 Tax=Sedimentisphaera cyanobacteriorum TaxID=1940790 RepID=A0A1Q2HPY5_9BACT|nr:alpha-L-fucosidase [Sedimentisphaera cyanobacteriorum]AQQ09488.1 Alpha-L-fucosidase [Sedimentisphaera cyanobacteriorum]